MDFSHFLLQNIGWVIAFLVLLFAYTYLEIKVGRTAEFILRIEDSVKLLNQKNTLVFDLRSASDFQNGHVSKAKNITKLELLNKFKIKIKAKDSNVLLICEKDSEGTDVAISLKRKGYKNVKFVGGGMKEWNKEQMPITKGPADIHSGGSKKASRKSIAKKKQTTNAKSAKK